MQQRYYDPIIGRFYSNDPVGFTASNPMMFNRYAYANNNPYKFVDPDGRNGVVAVRVPLFIPTKQQNHDATSTVPNQIRGDVGSRGEPRTSRGENPVYNEAPMIREALNLEKQNPLMNLPLKPRTPTILVILSLTVSMTGKVPSKILMMVRCGRKIHHNMVVNSGSDGLINGHGKKARSQTVSGLMGGLENE